LAEPTDPPSASGQTGPDVRKQGRMTPDKPDRRSERTRQALLAAFRTLVLDHPYETLTVGDIIERANIGRSTFYEHYDGKDALLAASVRGPFSMLAALVGSPDLPGSLVRTLGHFHQNQRMTRALLTGPARPILTRCLSDLIEERLRSLSREKPASPIIPDALAALHLAAGALTLIEHWLTARHACPAEALAEALFVSTNAAARALYRQTPT
jgi:AcrR family transcriptional regulator